MSGSQYQLQIEKLKELMAYLHDFDEEIQNAVNSYRAKLSALIEQGLPAEVGEKFTNDFFQQSKNLSDRNSAVIKDKAISFVSNNINVLERFNGFKKMSTKIAAGVVAGVATIAMPFARLSSTTTQVENGNNATNGVAHTEQGLSKKLGESAETVMNIVEQIAEGVKLKREAEEILEQSNALREPEQGEYRDE